MVKFEVFAHFFNFKIFQIFLYCKFGQFKLFFIIWKKPQKTAGPKKIYFAFWRPSICEKWHFFDLKIFQILLYCKFRQFKLFFIICKKPQVQKKLFRVLTTVNMRKMTFLSIFSTLKFFKFFYIVNLDNLNCFSSFA